MLARTVIAQKCCVLWLIVENVQNLSVLKFSRIGMSQAESLHVEINTVGVLTLRVYYFFYYRHIGMYRSTTPTFRMSADRIWSETEDMKLKLR